MQEIMKRVQDSVALGQQRVANSTSLGIQPELPYTDNYSIMIGNGIYFGVSLVLYLIMSKRKEPFQLKSIIAVYNVICVFLAGTVVYGIVKYKLVHPGTFACNALDESPAGRELGWYIWLFYIQKYWEFFDTWFFLLRKSFRQITFLHMFHHSSITFVVGSIISYYYNGDMYLPVVLNGFVHVLMYSHYLVTAIGVKPWWRPYLTGLQLVQFLLIATQSAIGWASGPSCGFDYAKALLIVYMGSMLALFGNFFVQSYMVKPKRSAKETSGDGKKRQ